jgi:hypothetical protein
VKRIDAWSAVATMVAAILGLGIWMDSGIERLHEDVTGLRTELRESIGRMDARLAKMDARLDAMDGRLDAMSERLARVEGALTFDIGAALANLPGRDAGRLAED